MLGMLIRRVRGMVGDVVGRIGIYLGAQHTVHLAVDCRLTV